MHDLKISHPSFAGFDRVFQNELFPQLAAKDGRRRQALRHTVIAGFVIAGLVLVAAFLMLQVNTDPALFVFLVFGGVALTGMAGLFFQSSIRSDTKSMVVGTVCRHLGWRFTPKIGFAPSLEAYTAHGLLPKTFHKSEFEDEITGSAHGTYFTALEAKLEKKTKDSRGRTKWVTVFRGSIIEMDFEHKFMGKVLVLRDKGWFNKKKMGELKRVGLADPKFEKAFEAYGSDQVESRYLLDPSFMQRLVDLETSVDGKNIRFGFFDGKLYIAVETPNRFEAGSMLKPLTDPARTQKVMDEAAAILNIIDGVMKPAPVAASLRRG